MGLTQKLAERIVYGMNMKEDESLIIHGGEHERELIEEVALRAMKRGVHVSFTISRDKFTERVYKEVPTRFFKKTSKLSLKQIDALDNVINFERPKDPKIFQKIDQKKLYANAEGAFPVRKKMDRKRVKWCYVGYPSKELAKHLGVSYALLKRFIFNGILTDIKSIVKKSNYLESKLKNAEFVHITDKHGTDLELKIRGRRINIDDGFISARDIERKDVGSNLPAGEVFLAPIENYGNGVLVSPKTKDRFTDKIIEDVELHFKNGRLDLKKSKAGKNEKVMKDTIRNCLRIDRKKQKTIRATNVAELGIGLNPVVNKIIGYILTDEKIGGTIHLAIGSNKGYGGTSQSSLHWDFVTNKGINLDVKKSDKTERIIENGKVLFK
jgi:aminopeptidase